MSLSAEEVINICQHMNQDHKDALILYAKVFAKYPATQEASMLSIDSQGMDLNIKTQDEQLNIRINFNKPITDKVEARQLLVAMVQEAQQLQSLK